MRYKKIQETERWVIHEKFIQPKNENKQNERNIVYRKITCVLRLIKKNKEEKDMKNKYVPKKNSKELLLIEKLRSLYY